MNKIRLLSEVFCINLNSNILKLIHITNRSLKLKKYENNVVLPAGRKLKLQFEYSDDYHRAKQIQRRKEEIVVNSKLNSALWSQNLINRFKNNFWTFISTTHFTPYTKKCISLTQTSVLNQKCVRYYSTQTKKKTLNDDLLTCKKKQEGCSFNKGKQETVPCPVPQEPTKIPDSKAICSEKICNEGANQEICQKREIKKDNSQKKIPQPITNLTPIKVNEKETQVKLNDGQKDDKLHHKKKCKICKPEPKFKLHRFRPPPTWKVWLYSFLGLTLKTSKIGLDLLKCCQITPSNSVTWVKLKEYPKPVLEPSKKHLSTEPGKRKLIRSNNVKADNKKGACKKEQSTISLKKDNTTTTTAKWAIQGSDTKVTVTEDKTIEQCKKIDQKIKIEKPSTDVISSSVDSIQMTTADFCRTLIDLCGSKTSSCNQRKKDGVPKKSNDNKETKKNDKQSAHPVICDKAKHACDKKIDTKNLITQMPYKRNSNSLETAEEFRKKKYGIPEMPEHYTGGAGEIERKLLEKQKISTHKVAFRYRDICKRKPEERIRGVNN